MTTKTLIICNVEIQGGDAWCPAVGENRTQYIGQIGPLRVVVTNWIPFDEMAALEWRAYAEHEVLQLRSTVRCGVVGQTAVEAAANLERRMQETVLKDIANARANLDKALYWFHQRTAETGPCSSCGKSLEDCKAQLFGTWSGVTCCNKCRHKLFGDKELSQGNPVPL